MSLEWTPVFQLFTYLMTRNVRRERSLNEIHYQVVSESTVLLRYSVCSSLVRKIIAHVGVQLWELDAEDEIIEIGS